MSQERSGKMSSLSMDVVNRQQSGDLPLQPQWRGGQTSPRGDSLGRGGSVLGSRGSGEGLGQRDNENGWNSEERAISDKDSGRFKPFFDPQARAQKWKEEDRNNRRGGGYEEGGFWGGAQQDRWGGRGRGRTGDDRWGTIKQDTEPSRWDRWDGGGPEWRSKTSGGGGAFNTYSSGEIGPMGRGRGRGRGTAFKGYGPGQGDKAPIGGQGIAPRPTNKLFTRRELKDIYDTMLVQGGSHLSLGKQTRVDELGLHAEHGQYLTFSSEHNDEDNGEDGGSSGEGQAFMQKALEHNQWLYKDPQGQWQGPYPKEMIIIWFNMNYFPDNLEVKSELDSQGAQVMTLKVLLGLWGPPPGFNAEKEEELKQSQLVQPVEEEKPAPTPTPVQQSTQHTSPLLQPQPHLQQQQQQPQQLQPLAPQVQPQSDPVIAPPNRKIESAFATTDPQDLNRKKAIDPVLSSFSQGLGTQQGLGLGPVIPNPQFASPQDAQKSILMEQAAGAGASWSPLTTKQEGPEGGLGGLLKLQQQQLQQQQGAQKQSESGLAGLLKQQQQQQLQQQQQQGANARFGGLLQGQQDLTLGGLLKGQQQESGLAGLLKQQQGQQPQQLSSDALANLLKQQQQQQQQSQQQQLKPEQARDMGSLLQSPQLKGMVEDPVILQQQMQKGLHESQLGGSLLQTLQLQQQLAKQGVRDPVLSQLLKQQQQLHQQTQQQPQVQQQQPQQGNLATPQSQLPSGLGQHLQGQSQTLPDLSSMLRQANNRSGSIPQQQPQQQSPAQMQALLAGHQVPGQSQQQQTPENRPESGDRFNSAQELLKILMPSGSQEGGSSTAATQPAQPQQLPNQVPQSQLSLPHQQAVQQQMGGMLQTNELLQKLTQQQQQIKPELLVLLQQQQQQQQQQSQQQQQPQSPLLQQQQQLRFGNQQPNLQSLLNPNLAGAQSSLGLLSQQNPQESISSKNLLQSLLPSQPQILQPQQMMPGGGGVADPQSPQMLQVGGMDSQGGIKDGQQSMMFLQRNVDKQIDPPLKMQPPIGSQVAGQQQAEQKMAQVGWQTVSKGKTFAEIQGEQMRQERGRGQPVSAQLSQQQSAAGGSNKQSAWNMQSQPLPVAPTTQQSDVHKTFRDIQLEEERLHKQQQMVAKQQQQARNEATFAISADGSAPRGGTIQDALEIELKGRNVHSSLYEESAADMEGGHDEDDDLPRVIPHQAPRVIPNFKLIQQQEEAARKKKEVEQAAMQRRQSAPDSTRKLYEAEPSSVWGRPQNVYVNGVRPQGGQQSLTSNIAYKSSSIHAQGGQSEAAQLSAPSRSAGSWANKLKPSAGQATFVSGPQMSSDAQQRQLQQQQQQAMRQPPVRGNSVPQLGVSSKQTTQTQVQQNGPGAVGDEAGECSGFMNEEFRAWCKQKMLELNGSSDLTLVEFLLTVQSNSEVAEYCSDNLGTGPKVSAFVSEFLKRRALDQQNQGEKKSKRNKKKKGKKGNDKGDGDEADDDRMNKAGQKSKGKRGEPVDKSQWGFRTQGSQYGLLANDE